MNSKAFTLIELLVVVAIIGILASVGVVAYNGYTDSAKRAKSMHNLENDQEAIDLLKHADHAQNEYFMKAFDIDFTDQSLYHLVLNTSNLNPEECSKVILNLVNNKLIVK